MEPGPTEAVLHSEQVLALEFAVGRRLTVAAGDIAQALVAARLSGF